MIARALRLVSAVLLAACVRSSSVPCGDQGVCREGTVCAQVTSPDQLLCVTPQQLEACEEPGPDGACTLAGVESARCYDNVCLPAGCGNLRADPGEVCDDGNDRAGDGCSSECRSNETCGNGIPDAIDGELCDDGNLLAHDGCDGACRPELPRWDAVDLAQPTPRQGAAIAFDARRGVAVMFGGIEDDSPTANLFGETWVWDGLGWLNAAPSTGPSSRAWAAMAYDAARDRIVLFGGTTGATASEGSLAETWEWDGTRWSLRPTAMSPPARAHHVMTYDAKRKRVVMFGGTAGVELADTWEWDGTTWTEVTGAAPPARRGGAFAFDPVRGASILFGGVAGLDELGDTWRFDGAWSRITTSMQPTARHAAVLAFDIAASKLVLYGGVNVNNPSSEVWTFESTTWMPRATQSAPLPRSGHAMTYDAARRTLVVFGGKAIDPAAPFRIPFCTAETYGLATTAWARLDASTPPLPPRYFHAASYDSLRRRVVIVGGTDGNATSAETWELRDDRAVRIPAAGPPKRHSAALAFDVANGKTLLFGGLDSAPLADTWAWNGTSWSNVTPGTSPAARSGHAMAFDTSRSRVVLFGGTGVSGASRETWEWNGTQWIDVTPAAGPSARQQAMLAYDPVAKRTVLFGGRAADGSLLDDTWTWDGTSWSQQQAMAVPPRRARGAMAWDGSRRRIVLVGGQASSATALNDAWEWSGNTWIPVEPPDVPSPRYGLVLVPSTTGAGVVAIGGAEITSGGATRPADARAWHLAWSGTSTDEQCQSAQDADGDGRTGCDDPDCWYVCSPSCLPGTSCTGPRCGDGQCTAGVESCALCPGDCGACPPVCGDFACETSETAAACPGDC